MAKIHKALTPDSHRPAAEALSRPGGKRLALNIALSPLLPLLLFLVPVFLGIDIGYQWDENYGKIRSLVRCLEDGVFLQGEYLYSGLNFWLTCIPLLPKLLDLWSRGLLDFQHAHDELVPIVMSESYKISVRYVFASVASTTIPGVYLISWRLHRNKLAAFFAAMLTATSWEFIYHSRWIAPDCILTALGTFSLLFLIIAIQAKEDWNRPIFWAAVMAGLGTGTKFPGGLLLLPVICTCLYLCIKRPLPNKLLGSIWQLGKVMVAFAVAFYLTTPAILIHPFVFWFDVHKAMDTYKGGWFGSTVTPGLPHFYAISRYLCRDFFSHFPQISVPLFALSLIGIVQVAKTQRKDVAAILIGTPLLYLAYFSTQSILIPRNYLFTTPALAALGGVGFGFLLENVSTKGRKMALLAVFGVAFAVNISWAFESASFVKMKTPRRTDAESAPKAFIEQLIDYIKSHPKERFIPSKAIREDLDAAGLKDAPNVFSTFSTPDDFFICYQTESTMQDINWPQIGRISFAKVFGPYQCNPDYYARYYGNEWIFLIRYRDFDWLPKFLPQLLAITPPPVDEHRVHGARWDTHGL